MGSFILVILIIAGCMWAYVRFMYPKPPEGYFLPKEGDSLEPKNCNFCGHSLAEYRGIVENELFFCNQEHQADFHAGKTYQPYQEKL